MSALIRVRARPWAGAGARTIGRADLAVLAFCALGVGNLWARRGAGNVLIPPDLGQFLVGFGLIALCAVLCLVASRRAAVPPSPVIVALAIAAQTVLSPVYLLPLWAMYLAGAALTLVPLLRRPTLGWAIAALVAIASGAVAAVQWWGWSASHIDVFAEVQGSTAALLHGQNPYAPVYSVFLDSAYLHPVYGSGSFDYGPAVVLLSMPARLLGDVRYTVLALNLAILAAVMVWAWRSGVAARLGPGIAALWVASPFVPFMVLLEWTDSFSMAGFAWWLVLRDRHRGWATVSLTLALASKPSMLPLMLPLMLGTRGVWRELVRAAAGTALIALPFALWTGIPQFVYDTVGIYGDLPTRRDSVNLDGISWALGHGFLPAGLLLLGTVAAAAAFALRRARDYGDLLVLGAGLMVMVCFFAKQAFLNYYYNAAIALLFVVGAGALAPHDAARAPLATLTGAARRRRQRGDRRAASAPPLSASAPPASAVAATPARPAS